MFKIRASCCLFVFDIRILITPLVSSNFSYNNAVPLVIPVCDGWPLFTCRKRLHDRIIALRGEMWVQKTNLKETSRFFYMLAKYVPSDIKYIFTKFYRHISTNNEANRKFVILISIFFMGCDVLTNLNNTAPSIGTFAR